MGFDNSTIKEILDVLKSIHLDILLFCWNSLAVLSAPDQVSLPDF